MRDAKAADQTAAFFPVRELSAGVAFEEKF
jgi:hypothetical protein